MNSSFLFGAESVRLPCGCAWVYVGVRMYVGVHVCDDGGYLHSSGHPLPHANLFMHTYSRVFGLVIAHTYVPVPSTQYPTMR